MLPGMQANLMSRMQGNDTTRGLSKELARYVRWEYDGHGATVRAAIAGARGARSARKERGVGRAVLRALGKLEESLVAVFATPGGA